MIKKRPYKGWAVVQKLYALEWKEMPQELWNAYTQFILRPKLFHFTWNLLPEKAPHKEQGPYCAALGHTLIHSLFHRFRCALPSPAFGRKADD